MTMIIYHWFFIGHETIIPWFIYKLNKQIGTQLYKAYIDSVSQFLLKAGININTSPVLDLSRKNTHKVIHFVRIVYAAYTLLNFIEKCLRYLLDWWSDEDRIGR